MRTVLALLFTSLTAFAQSPATDAKAYVKYDQLIDGTGAPASEDRMIVISGW